LARAATDADRHEIGQRGVGNDDLAGQGNGRVSDGCGRLISESDDCARLCSRLRHAESAEPVASGDLRKARLEADRFLQMVTPSRWPRNDSRSSGRWPRKSPRGRAAPLLGQPVHGIPYWL